MAATTDHDAPALLAPALDVGARLDDRYRLIGHLGAGGGGTVWRAFDEKVGEEVALKLVDAGADVERWRREVALARRISHANVCRVYDLGEAVGERWVTMELVAGENLRAMVERGVPVAQRPRLMEQLVDAVAAIHAAGVVHRDLKPENVVVEPRGRAVIVDFGLARRPGVDRVTGKRVPTPAVDPRVTRDGAILGTPRYMAPEQAAGGVADARSDVYALGLVLWEIAAGEPEAPWAAVIARCVAEAPATRFADARAVRAAVGGDDGARPRSRRRWVLAGAAAAVLGGGGAAAVMLGGGGETAPASRAPGPLTMRRLTTTGEDQQPSSVVLSPDGKRIAYTVRDKLYVRDVDGGVATEVPMPVSPSGRSLAKVTVASGWFPDGRLAVTLRDGRDDVWSTWAVGGGREPQLLFKDPARTRAALSPDGRKLAVAVPDRGILVVSTEGGATVSLTRAMTGEQFGGMAWSPDGARLAVVRRPPTGGIDTLELLSADGRVRELLMRGAFGDLADIFVGWTAPDRLVYARSATLFALRVKDGAADGDPVALASWPGELISSGSAARGRIAILRGTAVDQVLVGSLSKLGYAGTLRPALTDGSPSRRLAGWTPSGGVVLAIATAAGDHDIVEREAGGALDVLVSGPEDTLPETLVDGVVLYRRGPPDAVEIWRHEMGTSGPDALLHTARSDAAATSVVRCAGDKTTPCVIEEVVAGAARYARFDPSSGARSAVFHEAPVIGRMPRSMAVSPDGLTLALVDGSAMATTISLDGDLIGYLEAGAGAELSSVAYAHDGLSVLATGYGGDDDTSAVLRLDLLRAGIRQLAHGNRRRFGRALESPDGTQLAIQTRDIVLDLWLVDGLE